MSQMSVYEAVFFSENAKAIVFYATKRRAVSEKIGISGFKWT